MRIDPKSILKIEAWDDLMLSITPERIALGGFRDIRDLPASFREPSPDTADLYAAGQRAKRQQKKPRP